MGAELVANILEIKKGRTPDWAAAEHYLMSKSDDALADIAADLLGHHADAAEGPDQGGTGLERSVSETKAVLLKALESVVDCWHGASRNAIKYEATETMLLIVGGTTVGDPFREIEDIEAFVASGMARAAGFITSAS